MFFVEKRLRHLSEFTYRYLSSFSFSIGVVESKDVMLIALIVIKIVILLSDFVRRFITEN
jgi:hypothetical protein